MPPTTNAHPCGYVMPYLFNDTIFVVDSSGGTPDTVPGDLISEYAKEHFLRLDEYQLSQWVDVRSADFINWITPSYTQKKYFLEGKYSMPAGDYKLVIRNNFPEEGYEKSYLAEETTALGLTNHTIGFMLFGTGTYGPM